MNKLDIVDYLSYLKDEVIEKDREVNELKLLFRDKKIPFKVLDRRVCEVHYEIKDDIQEIINKYN